MTLPLKSMLRVSGGNPAGFPDFVPLNPWGRAMPVPAARVKPPVSQVVVRDMRHGGRETRVGPKCAKQWAEMWCQAIRQAIANGSETRWRDPQVVTFTAELGKRPTSLF
jgi:hypothetical protein